MAEIAGRLFCLIAMARYADEHAVARSARSFSSVTIRRELPYADKVIDLIDEICAQRLPEHLTQNVRDQRREQRAAEAAVDDLDVRSRLCELVVLERPVVGVHLGEAFGGRGDLLGVLDYSTDGYRLLRKLDSRASNGDIAPAGANGDEPVAEAA